MVGFALFDQVGTDSEVLVLEHTKRCWDVGWVPC